MRGNKVEAAHQGILQKLKRYVMRSTAMTEHGSRQRRWCSCCCAAWESNGTVPKAHGVGSHIVMGVIK